MSNTCNNARRRSIKPPPVVVCVCVQATAKLVGLKLTSVSFFGPQRHIEAREWTRNLKTTTGMDRQKFVAAEAPANHIFLLKTMAFSVAAV